MRDQLRDESGALGRRFGTGTTATIDGRINTHLGESIETILGDPPAIAASAYGPVPKPRCFLGGDPHLAAVERDQAQGRTWTSATAPVFTAAQMRIGGSDTTFTPFGSRGAWRRWTGTVDPRLAARRADADYLFPISRDINRNSRGVIYVDATVGISGTLRGKVTLHSAGNIVILDDLEYATEPLDVNRGCADVLGMISDLEVIVADNPLNTPRDINPDYGSGSSRETWRHYDEALPELRLHGIVMTRDEGFAVENYGFAPDDDDAVLGGFNCNGSRMGRGCLRLRGGLIQERRGAVGTNSGTGFGKDYTYDACGASDPPPYFPTTGRYAENRYTEIDPVVFEVRQFFRERTPDREPEP